MATVRVSSTDVHLIETDDGNISVTFEVLSHADYIQALADANNAEFVRRVLKNVSGLKLVKDDAVVEDERLLETLISTPSLVNWMFGEYQVFWQKKALTKPFAPLPDAGQASATPAPTAAQG